MPKEQFWKAINVLEYKFLSIPIAFFLLRMWTCIINLFYVYMNMGKIPPALIYLSVSTTAKFDTVHKIGQISLCRELVTQGKDG